VGSLQSEINNLRIYERRKKGGKTVKRVFVFLVGLLVFCVLGNAVIAATEYPTKPITLIINSGTGGMGDVTGRLISKPLGEHLGQPIIVRNKPGGAGAIGLSALAKARPDGYTIGITDPQALVVIPEVREIPYNLESFVQIGSYVKQEAVLVSTLDVPWTTFEELVDYTRQNPNIVVIGETGDEWFALQMNQIALHEGLKWRVLRFGGGGEGSAAILGGHIDLLCTGTGTPADLAAREGKLKRLVILSQGHIPGIENLQDKGYPYGSLLNRSILVPAGISESIRQTLEDALRKATEDSAFRAGIEKIGLAPVFVSGSEYERWLRDASAIVKKSIEDLEKMAEG